MSETLSVVQEDEVKADPFDQELRDAEDARFLKELETQEEKKTLQEQAAEELQKNEQAREDLDTGKQMLKDKIGFQQLDIVSEAVKITFVEVNGKFYYQDEAGNLSEYQSTTGEEFKIESLEVEEDFNGPENGGSVKIYMGSHEDALGRTVHEFIQETYRPPKTIDIFLGDENSPELIEAEFNDEQKSEKIDSLLSTDKDYAEATSEQAQGVIIENNQQQKNEFTLESLFSAPENIITNDQKIATRENNFLNLEIFSLKNPEATNVISPETKQIADLITQEIRQNTIQKREHSQEISIESSTTKSGTAPENNFQIKDVRSSTITERVTIASEKSADPIKQQIEKPAARQSETQQTEKIFQIITSEKPSFQLEVSKIAEEINKPETHITISLSEKPHALEFTTQAETKPSPAETIRTTMRPVAETRITLSPAALTANIEWGKQNMVDVIPTSISENLQQSMQELSHSPTGTEMVITGTEATNDTALIFRVEQPGKVSVELYKAPMVEVTQNINPITEITQTPIETVQAETMQNIEKPTSEAVMANEIIGEQESTNNQTEKSAETTTQFETITIKQAENTSPENRPTIQSIETPAIANQTPESPETANIANNSERRSRLIINSFFPEEENEPTPSPAPRQQPAAANSRQLAA